MVQSLHKLLIAAEKVHHRPGGQYIHWVPFVLYGVSTHTLASEAHARLTEQSINEELQTNVDQLGRSKTEKKADDQC